MNFPVYPPAPPMAKAGQKQFPAIFNASVLTVNQAVRTQPQVGNNMQDWFVDLTFVKILREQQDSQIIEKATPFVAKGFVQPFSGRVLEIMKQGDRSWKWSSLFALPALILNVQDIVIDQMGHPHRVQTEKDFSLYGFVRYYIIRDYDYQPTLGA